MCSAHNRIISVCCVALAIWLSIAGVARANEQNGTNPQSAYQPAVSPVARLQVSGSGDRLSVDVERADVQSTLKSVLKQAGKQFVPDATVTGQVTLLLTDQPLETVLHAVCDGCYLKYTRSAFGIYRFSRDDDAVKRAFSQLGQLNAQLRTQLRALGLDVPAEDQFGAARLRVLAAGVVPGAPTDYSLRDGAKKEKAAERSVQNSPAGAAGAAPLASDALGSAASRKPDNSSGFVKKDAVIGNTNIHAYLVPQGEVSQFLGQNQIGRGGPAGQFDLRALVQQNGFVSFNIPEEKPEPVASVLQLFSQQSNVPILIDQSIPNSLKFRVWGNLSPRQLPEALNVLAPTAHLQWRWIGNTIFVVPAPNFLVYFGDLATFRSQYPAPSRSETTGQGAGGRRGGSD